MKKLFFAVVILFAAAQAQAQFSFKPGFRAGVNFSHFSNNDDYYDDGTGSYSSVDFKAKTDFYAGFIATLHLTKYYTLQPEVTYSRQGTKYKSDSESGKLDISYLSIAVVNKFTFNKFNVHVGPTIDFMVDKSTNFDADSEVDLAFTAGFGYEITPNLGVELRAKKGIVPVIDNYDTNQTNVVFSAGLTYNFDIK